MSRFAFTEFGLVDRIVLDGEPTLVLLCPGCGTAARMDDDQAHGRVSVDHASDGCLGRYHETHDFWAAAERAGWQEGEWHEAVEHARQSEATEFRKLGDIISSGDRDALKRYLREEQGP